jgi:hypothetical protein
MEHLLQSGERILSGWLPALDSFWLAHDLTLHLLTLTALPDGLELTARVCSVPCPIHAVGDQSGLLVASHASSFSLFSLPDLDPLGCTFYLPSNLTVTAIEGDLAGCSDGRLRTFSVNPRSRFISVSGLVGLGGSDEITRIVRAEGFAVALSASGILSVWREVHVLGRRLVCADSVRLGRVVAVWVSADRIFAVEDSAMLSEFAFDGAKLAAVHSVRLFRRLPLVSALWAVGLLVSVEGGRLGSDRLTVARFQPSPLYFSEPVDRVLCLADSRRYVSVLTARSVGQLYERLEPVNADEEAWCFANTIVGVWDAPADALVRADAVVRGLERWPAEAFPHIGCLARYVLTIVDDLDLLAAYGPIPRDPLSAYFGDDRLRLFPRLRRLAFSVRMRDDATEAAAAARGDVAGLIAAADAGSELAAQQAVAAIGSSDALPADFRAYVAFLRRHSFHRELIDCVLRWAASILPDSNALAFQNAAIPPAQVQSQDPSSAYVIRQDVYNLLLPTIEAAAIAGSPAHAAVRDALASTANESFRRFALQVIDRRADPDALLALYFPGMIGHLTAIRSPHIGRIVIVKGEPPDRFRAHMQAAADPSPEVGISERIEHLQRAHVLFPDDPEPKRWIRIARAIEAVPGIARTHPEFFDAQWQYIVDVLRHDGEFRAALDVLAAVGQKNEDIIRRFVESADAEEVREYIETMPEVSEEEIAEIIYGEHGIDGLWRFVEQGKITHRILFTYVAARSVEENRREIDRMIALLANWDAVELEIREEVAKVYCALVLLLDVEGRRDIAEEIRLLLGKCFLEQRFTDEWDNI